MAITLTEKNEGKQLEVQVGGKLTHQVLFEMVDFHGWEGAALWYDIKFEAKHFSDIERLAMVGDKKWEKGMSVFCKPFTAAKIRYFDSGAIAEARAWLEQAS